MYTEQDLQNAYDEVKASRSSVRSASIKYGIPRKTLENKVKGKTPMVRKMAPPPVLSTKEEKYLVEWIKKISRVGFPLVKDDILLTVQKILINCPRKNDFKDNKPGKKWFE